MTTHPHHRDNPNEPDTVPETRFVLVPGEGAEAAVHRVLFEQIDLAKFHASRLRRADGHVHEMRKAAKRIRSVLRMVRHDMGRDSYREMNAVVRDAGRAMSFTRALVAMGAAFDGLIDADPLLGGETGELRALLDRDAASARAAVSVELEHDIVDRFVATRAILDTVPEWGGLASQGVSRTYRRARSRFAAAYAQGPSERFHAWRKEIKYLRHQLEVVALVSATDVERPLSQLVSLGETLGEHNDLADLARWGEQARRRVDQHRGVDPLLRAVAEARSQREAEMRGPARELFEPIPDRFVARVFPLRE